MLGHMSKTRGLDVRSASPLPSCRTLVGGMLLRPSQCDAVSCERTNKRESKREGVVRRDASCRGSGLAARAKAYAVLCATGQWCRYL